MAAGATAPLAAVLDQLRQRRMGGILLLDAARAAIESARDLPEHAAAVAAARECAMELVGQGVAAWQLTGWITRVTDDLTCHLVQSAAEAEGLDLARGCWLAFGSQARGEQTLYTDQDNGLVLADGAAEEERQAWLRLGRRVNAALARCGFAACEGQVMAGEPACCLTAAEWQARFSHWIEHGAPRDLLNACIYFDMRPVAGRWALAGPLRGFVAERARGVPRFLKQLAENALRNPVPLGWRGQLESSRRKGREVLNMKLQGTMLFVDAARLYALAHGIEAPGTRERLEAFAAASGVPAHEARAWIGAFDHVQQLRLRAQLARGDAQDRDDRPNLLALDGLDDLERRVLKEALRMAQALQQRMALDFQR